MDAEEGVIPAGFEPIPFRYPGSIAYALDVLLALIPEHTSYIEPFCGGATIFFGKPVVKKSWLNDIDKDMIETYRVIRDQPEKLAGALSREEISEGRYRYFRDETPQKDSFETALRWFYLNQTSRLDAMSLRWERDDSLNPQSAEWTKTILRCSRKLQGVKLTSIDFEETLREAPEGTFLFIAPPYSIHQSPERTKLHKYPFEREAHFRLASMLRSLERKVKFMVLYNENEELRRIYSWGDIVCISPLPNQPPRKKEMIIRNY